MEEIETLSPEHIAFIEKWLQRDEVARARSEALLDERLRSIEPGDTNFQK